MAFRVLSVVRRHCIALLFLASTVGTLAVQAAPTKSTSLLVVGDSLSAEYGLKRGSGWVALLEQRLAQDKRTVTVVNASISGDTTSGGRARLPALLEQHRPGIVVIELGGNDALRGFALEVTRMNLDAMVQSAQAAGAKVLLVGMEVPPNYGADYTRRFAQTYRDVSKQRKTALVPFLLKDIADAPDAAKWFQADRIHPNESAHPLILDNVWPALKALLP